LMPTYKGSIRDGCLCPNGIRWDGNTARDHFSGFLYAMIRHADLAIKIGYTRHDPKLRVLGVRSYKANGAVDLVYAVRVGCMVAAEKVTHHLLEDRRLPPSRYTGVEWFSITTADAIDVLRRFEVIGL
jgi:hypothetical protein